MAQVLIVEPEPEIRRLFSHMLTRLGHDPVVADLANGRAPDCDVIVLEPAWAPGTELVEEVLRERPWVPVIAASIFAPRERERIPLVRHLVKPFTLAQFSDAVADAVTRRPRSMR